MNERLLQFIWSNQYYNRSNLSTTRGEQLSILHPGQMNRNQGPDFLNAKIRIEKTKWAGHIELHLKTSDWIGHQHNADPNFKNVILHVVWQNDLEIDTPLNIPTLELNDRVSRLLLEQYEKLMNTASFIPCDKIITQVPGLLLNSWKDRLIAERLSGKAARMNSFLEQSNFHWEESFWWMLARNFGMTVNTETFEAIARSLPLTILAKHKSQLIQLEALLFGQAGLLGKRNREAYPKMLAKEYSFLRWKYKLQPVHLPIHFLRMRPGNFPSVRLAQLAALIADSSHLFSLVRETNSLDNLRKYFDITANDYWHYHYRFDESCAYKRKNLGKEMIDNILINTICPALFTYGMHYHDQATKEKAISWLEQISPEKNSITKGFTGTGLEIRNALDSQAMLELKKTYCDQRMCLQCAIGNHLLKL